MPSIVFSPAARAELVDAIEWYDGRDDGLGDRFLMEVDATTARIAANARQFPIVFEDIRRARLRRFPYSLFFRVSDDATYVIACFHGSRDPRRWQARA